MSKVIVRYKVKPEFADENTRLVKAVLSELNDKKPDGLRYATFVGEDGVTFFHVASVEGDKNPLFDCEAFKAFQNDIAQRYEQSASVTQVEEIGSYNFFD